MSCTNDDRVGRAAAAIRASYGDGIILSNREQACDLLADLMHWCDAEGVCFECALDTASTHYQAEILDDGLGHAGPALSDVVVFPEDHSQTRH